MAWETLVGIAAAQREEIRVEERIRAERWYCPLCLERLSVTKTGRDCPYGHYFEAR